VSLNARVFVHCNVQSASYLTLVSSAVFDFAILDMIDVMCALRQVR
jgi:hypothetical protein